MQTVPSSLYQLPIKYRDSGTFGVVLEFSGRTETFTLSLADCRPTAKQVLRYVWQRVVAIEETETCLDWLDAIRDGDFGPASAVDGWDRLSRDDYKITPEDEEDYARANRQREQIKALLGITIYAEMMMLSTWTPNDLLQRARERYGQV